MNAKKILNEIKDKQQVNLQQDLFPIYKPLPPFIPFTLGFGYFGVILQSSRNGKIQCHICGELFKSVGRHVTHSHGITNEEYRELVGLNAYTPLVCENTSMRQREGYNNLPQAEKDKRTKHLHEMNKKVHKEGRYKRREKKESGGTCRVQMLNKFGTCDVQAKHYFWEEYGKLGRIPMGDEISGRLRHLIYSRFNSYEEALTIWGVDGSEIHAKKELTKQRIKEGQVKTIEERTKRKKDTFMVSLYNFYLKKGRLPSWEEARRIGFPHRSFWYKAFGTTQKSEMTKYMEEYMMVRGRRTIA